MLPLLGAALIKGSEMRVLLVALMIGIAQPVLAQQAKPADDAEIVVTGIANGARIVEVDFDKVWKNCAECKRALAKLDRLAAAYRAELDTALAAVNRSAPSSGSPPSVGVTTFTRSSATNIETWDEQRRTGLVDVQRSVSGERQGEQSRAYFNQLNRRFVRPESVKLAGHMRSFLDQLAPHLAAATEAERVANGARAGLTDKKRTRLAAKNLTRIDVTDAVIRRLDAMDFKIKLPEPVPSPARR